MAVELHTPFARQIARAGAKGYNHQHMPKLLMAHTILILLLSGCSPRQFTPLPTTHTSSPFTPTALKVETKTPLPPTSTITPLPTSTSTPEPIGCLEPPKDYTRVNVNGETLSQRTLSMLTHAQVLYGGKLEITGYAVTQGSYTNSLAASFGTHAGGGAVDLSVLQRETYTVLWDDIQPLIHALRSAGFAAWLREYGELYEGSPIHIHAIAVGDRELSTEAANQLTGEAGYFLGYNGLPLSLYGLPTPDKSGGPIVCTWMIDLGYRDLR
jgi:hypothetical protein